MEKDCRDQFNQLRPKIRKHWLKTIAVLIGGIPYFLVVSYLFNNLLDYFMLGYAVFNLYIGFGLFKLKCPNCSKSLYVTLYVENIPVICQTWINSYCNHCGARLK